MKRIPFWLVVCTTVALAAFAGRAISAQDKYTLQVPDGLSFAEFRGYEDWQVVSISQATIPSIGENLEGSVKVEYDRTGGASKWTFKGDAPNVKVPAKISRRAF